MSKEDNIEITDYDLKKSLLSIFNKISLVVMILIIVLNIMICIVLVYYGNVLAFLFIINIYYVISYYRMIKREKVRNDLG